MASRKREKKWLTTLSQLMDDSPKRVFTRAGLTKILEELGPQLDIPQSMRISRFINILTEEASLQTITARRTSRTGTVDTKTRYSWGTASPYAFGDALLAGAYLSHASAMFLHALTDQVPKTIYVNKEQSPKQRPTGRLNQSAINRAFKRQARKSSYTYTTPNARYVLLSGKNSGRLEVSQIRTPSGEVVDATKLERTLIDIVVRPAYAGGPREVLQAYQTATPDISVNTLIATLKKLDYIYPYHQAVGFLLERAGAPESQLSKLENLGIEWDFYLANQISDPEFNSRWRLYHPQGF